MADRFIKVYEKMLKWEWYKNTNVKVLFLHLLLRANYKEMGFEGHAIARGQLVTSLDSLASELGLTRKQIRGSLDHLIATGEVASKSYPRYRVITIVHYDDYQSDGRLNGSQRAGERAVKGQAEGKQRAGSGQAEGKQRATSIEYIENIEQIDKIEKIDSPSERGTAKRFVPPTREEILSFCREAGIMIDPDRFIDYYSSTGWRVGRNKTPMKDWKASVRMWASRDKEEQSRQPAKPQVKTVIAQDYPQRSYEGEQERFKKMMEDRYLKKREEMKKNGQL